MSTYQGNKGSKKTPYSSASRPSRPTGSKPRFSASKGPSRPFKHGSKPSFRGNPSPSRGGGRGGRKGSFERIDVSRFISKSTIIEKEEIYLPTHTFRDFAIDARLTTAIANKNYIYPSPIQDKSIPHALQGRDILGIADTGTGKTASFLIPLINKVLKDPKETAILKAPIRNLEIRIKKKLKDFARE